MKKFSLLSLLGLFAVVMCFCACSSDDDDNGGPIVGTWCSTENDSYETFEMTFSKDGKYTELWEYSSGSKYMYCGTYKVSGNKLTIYEESDWRWDKDKQEWASPDYYDEPEIMIYEFSIENDILTCVDEEGYASSFVRK